MVLVPAAALAVTAEYRLNITPVVEIMAAPSFPACENKNIGEIKRQVRIKKVSEKVLADINMRLTSF
jgi:hypothetical protein